MRILISIILLPVLTLAQPGSSRSTFIDIELDQPSITRNYLCRSLTAAVGDSTSAEFCPRLELRAWAGECLFAIDLNDSQNAGLSYVSRDTLNGSPALTCRLTDGTSFSVYHLSDGDLEWEIKLDTPPDSNTLVFDFTARGLIFYYQDSTLSADDIRLDGPPWAQGSYAVYHASKRGNRCIVSGSDTTHEIYTTGKAFHIKRPRAFDSGGDSVWCDLHIDTRSGQLSITIPEEFLKEARYPLTVDPTFGKTSVGAYDMTVANYRHIVLWNIGALETGAGSITGGYVYCDVSGNLEGTIQLKIHSYSKGTGLNDSKYHASSATTNVTDTAPGWVPCSMSGTLLSGTTYMATIQAYNSVANKLRIKGDITTWGDIKFYDVGSWGVPDSLTGYGSKNEGYSAYVEYTTSGGEPGAPLRRRRVIQSIADIPSDLPFPVSAGVHVSEFASAKEDNL